MSDKPTGVLLLAILQLIQAIVALAIGALAFMAGAMLLPIFGLLFAFFPIIFGIIGLLLFYGLYTLKSWAWLWALIINILSLLVGLMGNLVDISNLISIALSAIIVIYLLMPATKAHFR
ncbi:MAG: hypothetical protein ACFFCX_16700 [Candidatus Sifarchaeia archaeon]